MINVIDISNYNIVRDSKTGQLYRDIIWENVATDPFHPQAIYIKLGEGYWPDYRLDDAQRCFDKAGEIGGIPYRAWYLYAHPEYPVDLQAKYAKKRAAGRPGELPQIRDYEDNDCCWFTPHPLYKAEDYPAARDDAEQLRRWLIDDLKAHDDAFGRLTSIYTGGWWLNWVIEVSRMYGQDVTPITSRPLYNACYLPTEQVALGWTRSYVWQYSDQGKIAGIPGSVDLNVFHGEIEDLAAWAKDQPILIEEKHEEKHEEGHEEVGEEPVSPAVTTRYEVTNEYGLYLRPGPANFSSGKWLACGSCLDVVKIEHDWAQVSNPVGYVKAKYIKAC